MINWKKPIRSVAEEAVLSVEELDNMYEKYYLVAYISHALGARSVVCSKDGCILPSVTPAFENIPEGKWMIVATKKEKFSSKAAALQEVRDMNSDRWSYEVIKMEDI